MPVNSWVQRTIAKTTAYTINPNDDRPMTRYSNKGAVGSVTFTLPSNMSATDPFYVGRGYEFFVVADQSLIVACTGKLVAPGNAAADNVGFQVAGSKLGGYIKAVWTGTQWQVFGDRANGGFCVNGSEQVPTIGGTALTATAAEINTLAGVTAGVVSASKALVVDATKQLLEGLLFLMGTSTGAFKPSGILSSQFSVAGVGNGADLTDDTLFTFTFKANSLNSNGDRVRMRASGVTAANGNNKQIKIFFGATAVVASGVITSNAKNWVAEVEVVRTGAGAQLAFGRFTVDGVADVLTKSTPAADETTDLTLKATGASSTTGAANDILGNGFEVWALPT